MIAALFGLGGQEITILLLVTAVGIVGTVVGAAVVIFIVVKTNKTPLLPDDDD
jgi:hypothetical protein